MSLGSFGFRLFSVSKQRLRPLSYCALLIALLRVKRLNDENETSKIGGKSFFSKKTAQAGGRTWDLLVFVYFP